MLASIVGSGVGAGRAVGIGAVVGAGVGVAVPELLRQPVAANTAKHVMSVNKRGDRGVIA